ncbi:DUF4352 domain-containing protein [Streptococcus suis]|uniref:ATPase n=1 Tax=Streptococcus suis TaxID=1307 RepID=A0A822VI38_STRSU|nr:DUF4352 domain-containing protein [Streptococcus suis]AGZ22350.1 putative ATPase involved in replication control, Cdc46/Mcm family [Streptococcus suis T15]MCB2882740.1 DUF4352 domain-containing protein [Streptococcus suis]MCB2891038.1 DUF4352 domain-containing protein [Streptococcus suis]MCB2909545.1 DUF4352 domain-containing protein [Streptococcus suis]MCB2911661.1 DUF4352 domain-containing protein [Streptococcus suis]
MQTKDFVVENGQMYYKKKPLHKQPLFWTTIACAVLSFILGVTCFIFMIGLSSANFDNWDTGSDGYIDETVEYTEYQVGDSVDFSNGLHVTVTSMGKDDSIELVDSYYSTAYVVEMEVENSTAKELYFDEYYFSLMDPVSQIPFTLDLRTYDVNLVEKLKPGEKVQVKLIYGIDNETNFGFTYEDAMWTELVAEGI